MAGFPGSRGGTVEEAKKTLAWDSENKAGRSTPKAVPKLILRVPCLPIMVVFHLSYNNKDLGACPLYNTGGLGQLTLVSDPMKVTQPILDRTSLDLVR